MARPWTRREPPEIAGMSWHRDDILVHEKNIKFSLKSHSAKIAIRSSGDIQTASGRGRGSETEMETIKHALVFTGAHTKKKSAGW